MTESTNEAEARAAEEIGDDVEVFDGDSDFEVSPTKNVHPDNLVQDDEVEVEVKDA